MSRFHETARGPYVRLSDNNRMACRLLPRSSYNGGMVFSAEPLEIGRIFTIKIENILSCWCGSIEIGILIGDPETACTFHSASSIETLSWVLSGEHVYKSSHRYCTKFVKYFDFRQKISIFFKVRFLSKISIFFSKVRFLSKISIFFSKVRFFFKISIFVKNFDLVKIFDFFQLSIFVKSSIFVKIFDLFSKFRFFFQNFNFVKDFDFVKNFDFHGFSCKILFLIS